MAAKAGRNAALYCDEFDLSGKLTAIGLAMTAELGEDTRYQQAWRRYKWLLKNWGIDLAGFYEGTDTAGELDKVLKAVFGTTAKIIALPGGDSRGDYGYAGSVPINTQHNVTTDIGALSALASHMEGSGALERCIVLYQGTVIATATSTYVEWDNPPIGSELLSNPGFETAGAGGADIWGSWTENAGDGTLANEITIIHGGSDAMKATSGASSDTYVYQDVTVVAGTRYKLVFWARGDGTYAGQYHVYDQTGSADIIAKVSTGVTAATYTEFQVYFNAPTSCNTVRLYLYCPSTDTGVAYFDDVSVKECEGVVNGSAYLSVTAASGTSPTMGITVKHCPTAAGTYASLSPTFTQATAATSERIAFTTQGIGANLQITYAIGGSSPSFTFVCVFHGP